MPDVARKCDEQNCAATRTAVFLQTFADKAARHHAHKGKALILAAKLRTSSRFDGTAIAPLLHSVVVKAKFASGGLTALVPSGSFIFANLA
jgi:hypothetical protein